MPQTFTGFVVAPNIQFQGSVDFYEKGALRNNTGLGDNRFNWRALASYYYTINGRGYSYDFERPQTRCLDPSDGLCNLQNGSPQTFNSLPWGSAGGVELNAAVVSFGQLELRSDAQVAYSARIDFSFTAFSNGAEPTSGYIRISGLNLGSNVQASENRLAADGVASSIITVTLNGIDDVPLGTSAGPMNMSATLGRLSAVTDNNDGTYTATLSSETPGRATVSATFNGGSEIGLTRIVEFIASSNSGLSNMALSTGSESTPIPISPTFTTETNTYSAQVLNSVASIRLTPTAQAFGTSIAVNGQSVPSGTASEEIALEVGSNTIAVLSTAQDGSTTSTYSINVERTQLPELRSSTPAANAIGISLTPNITLNFSQAVRPNTGNIELRRRSDNTSIETISVTSPAVTGAGSESIDIALTQTLDDLTEYYLLIDSAAFVDELGNAFVGISDPNQLVFTTADLTIPELALIQVPPSLTNNTTPSVIFSSTESGRLIMSGACGTSYSGNIASGNTTIPLTQLDGSTPLASGVYDNCAIVVEDLSGNRSEALTISSFTVDTLHPTASFTPSYNTSGVAFDTNILIDLSETIQLENGDLLANSNIQPFLTLKKKDAAGESIAFSATINGNRITIDPTDGLSSSQRVYVAIGSGLQDLANNPLPAGSATFIVAAQQRPTVGGENDCFSVELSSGAVGAYATGELRCMRPGGGASLIGYATAGKDNSSVASLGSLGNFIARVCDATYTNCTTTPPAAWINGQTYYFKNERTDHPTGLVGYWYGEYKRGTGWVNIGARTDNVRPTVSITSSQLNNADTSSAISNTFIITVSENTWNFTSGDIQVSNGVVSNFIARSQSEYEVTISALVPGAVTLSVPENRLTDARGNSNTASNVFSWIFQDTEKPTATLNPANGQSNVLAATAINITLSEDVRLLSGDTLTSLNVDSLITLKSDNANGPDIPFDATVQGNVITVTPTSSFSSGQIVFVQLSPGLKDLSNNTIDIYAATFTIADTDSPSVLIQGALSALTNNNPFTLQFQFSEDVSGFVAQDITLENATLNNFTAVDSRIYTADISPLGTGNITVSIAQGAAQDLSGNNSIAATPVVIAYDATRPDVVIQGAPLLLNTPTNFTITVEFTEEVTGFESGDISLTNASVTGFTALDPTRFSVQISPNGNGNITINITENLAQDMLGNGNTAASEVIILYDATSPELITITPPNGASSVALDESLIINFSENVFGNSGNIKIYDSADDSIVQTIAVDSSYVSGLGTSNITVTPPLNLMPAKTFYVLIDSNSFRDAAGNDYLGLTDPTVFRFSTVSTETIAPSVEIRGAPTRVNSMSPFTVTFAFSENVGGFAPGSIRIENGTSSNFAQVNSNTYTAVVTPNGTGNISISLDTTTITDFANPPNSTLPVTPVTVVYDTSVPTLSATSPANNATNVALNTNITLTFSEPVNAQSGNITLVKTSDNSTVETIAVTSSQVTGTGTNTITINPSADLLSNTAYHLLIDNNAFADAAANAFAGITSPSTLAFTTLLVDTTAPTVTIAPANGASAIPANASITLTLSEDVRLIDNSALTDSNIDALITLKTNDASGADIAFDATVSGRIITITPSSPLNSGQTVYVAIGATLEDLFDNPISPTSATFTVADTSVPTLSATSPANNATNVALNTNITLTFSEPVNAQSGNITLVKTSDNSTVETIAVTSSQVTGTGTNTITINPSADLLSNTAYHLLIDNNAFADAAANAFAGITSPSTLAFTTLLVDTTAPTVTIAAQEVSNGQSSDHKYLTIIFTTNKPTSNFESNDITVVNANISEFSGTGSAYQAQIMPYKPGAIQIYVNAGQFTDLAGNENLPSAIFNWEYKLPSPLNKKDVIDSIYAASKATTNASETATRHVRDRINWLKDNSDTSGKRSHQGIKLNFSNQLLQNFFKSNSVNNSPLHESLILRATQLAQSNSSMNTKEVMDIIEKEALIKISTKMSKYINLPNLNFDSKSKINDWSWWTAGEVLIGNESKRSNSSKIDFNAEFLTFGLDRRLHDNTIFGASITLGDNNKKINKAGSMLDTKSASASLYGSKSFNETLSVSASLGLSKFNIDSTRIDEDQVLFGKRSADQTFSTIEVSKTYNNFFANQPLRHNIFIRNEFIYTRLDNFSESGGIYAINHGELNIKNKFLRFGIDSKSRRKALGGEITFKAGFNYSLNFTPSSTTTLRYLAEEQIYKYKLERFYQNEVKMNLGLSYTLNSLNIGISYSKVHQKNNRAHEKINLSIKGFFK